MKKNLKKFIVFVFVLVFMCVPVISNLVRVSADSVIFNEGSFGVKYTGLILPHEVGQNGGYFYISDIYIYDDGKIQFDYSDDIDFIQDDNFENSPLIWDNYYLIYKFQVVQGDFIYVYQLLSDYIYELTINSNSSSFNDGVKQGVNDTKDYYNNYIENNFNPGGSGYEFIYQSGFDDGVYSADSGNITFFSLLREIATYPVKIFTEGLNVEIFGVNLGDFCLGIIMLAIVLAILKLVF